MKIKLLRYLIIVALLSPLFLFSNKVYALETVNDLKVTYGENLLSLSSDDVLFEKGILSTKKKIYYPCKYKGYGITVIVPKDTVGSSLSCTFEYYDIDFTKISSETLTEFIPLSYNETLNSYMTNSIPPEGAFSFSFKIEGLQTTMSLDKTGIMLLDTDQMFFLGYEYSYVSYIPTNGFIDLCKEIKPTLEVSYTKSYSKEYIEGLVEIIDACSGDVKDLFTIDSSSYLAKPSTVGTYTVNIYLTSDKSKTTVGSFNIKVKDEVKPIIEGPDSLDIPAKTTIDKAYLVSKGYLFKDDYDDTNELTSSLIITNSLNGTSTLGTGTLTLKLVDTNTNYITKDVAITIKDVVAPTIEVVSKTIEVSYEYILGVNSLIQRAFTITDDYTSNPTITIVEDGYTDNSRTVGTYTVKIKATDGASNSSEESFTIKVYDTIPPVIFLNTYRIETDITVKLTKDDIVNTLLNVGVLNKTKKYSIEVKKDEYTGNENKIGLYEYQIECIEENKEPMLKTLEINVTDISTYDGTIVSKTLVIENENNNRVPLIIISSSIIVIGSAILIVLKRKNKPIKPRRF